ncbi:aldehyde dehydrogenase, dimeric NADP-preferring-like [Penaeus japonicus]|uniref:aldehyde dehydrogenase, dimeric NADP-preferring-like n=1 Tax=Penaeus japonicus TaxID=27405 RepID=UPI001C71088E|nr:aldehyde dehydrogenase, dimeric NADP-preferring-like [Penaeus japonicus]
MPPSYKELVDRARSAFNGGRTLSVEFRRQQLQQLGKMYRENRAIFVDALKSDLNKPELEAMMMEVHHVEDDVNFILNRLDKWVQTEEVPSKIPMDQSVIYNEPYGVVLVMGAWNYPLQLTMLPVAGAIAAGNAVVIKPSEVSPATASAIAKLVPQYLDKECYPVVCGGVPETTELLKERFDYIFYTGSTTVGKIVRDAANKFLTPTTLELGGKSPCFIDNTVDLAVATRRILWGKMINLGQTCIAPDYILCTKEVQEVFVKTAKEVLREWYGEDPSKSKDLCRIVAGRHVERLATYLDSGKVVIGGKYNVDEKWMEPTLLVDVGEQSKVMTDEIFGPILPIINVKNHVDAIEFINKREKPLALYVFSTKKDRQEMFMRQVPCGGATLNDTIFHVGSTDLPFGGVGNSGMGAYHGKYTFDTFTHRKSCLKRSYNSFIDKLMQARYPPYTEKKMNMLISQRDKGDGPGVLHYLKIIMTNLISMGLGALILYLILHYSDAKV